MPPRDFVNPSYFTSRGITRRRLLTAVPALGLMLAGLACGDDDDDSSSRDESALPSANAGWPRTVKHALGETTIPSPPVRVAAVNDGEALDHLLAVGIVPVIYGQTPGYDGEGKTKPWVLEAGVDTSAAYPMARGEPDFERMAAAAPDLIVGAWIPEDQYRTLSSIAPTIIIKDHDSTAWPEMQRLAGEATGREAEAEQALGETEAVLDEGAKALEPYRGRRVMIGYNFFDELYIHGANTPIARLLVRMGLTVEGPDPNDLTILSLERINELEGADILLSPVFFAEDQEKFEASPLLRSLPAVQQGRYMPLPLEIAEAGYLESTLSVRWVVPKLVEAVIEAAEGRGKRLA